MSRYEGLRSQIPLLFGLGLSALILASGCTFEPPGSVLNNQPGPGADASPLGAPDAAGQLPSTETLTVTFTTAPVGQVLTYAPANIVAVWVEDAGGHVATIFRSGSGYVNTLGAWRAASGPNNLDAVTGATRINHATPLTATWAIPGGLPMGTYTIRAETSDSNDATPAANNQGSFPFEKNGVASNVPGLDGNGYTAITIDYAVAAP